MNALIIEIKLPFTKFPRYLELLPPRFIKRAKYMLDRNLKCSLPSRFSWNNDNDVQKEDIDLENHEK